MNSEEGIVYVLTNPTMTGLVKIGMTTRSEVEIRMSELYSTGVPLPFECSYAGRVGDVKKIERAFHKAFGPYRINPNREFFEIEPVQAIGLLEIICDEEVTPQVKTELDKVDEVSKEAGEAYTKKKRRPNLNFKDMGIEVGDKLYSNVNEEYCIVENQKQVLFRGEMTSLTRATRLVLDNDYDVNPTRYWMYNGRNLNEIYNETYGSVES